MFDGGLKPLDEILEPEAGTQRLAYLPPGRDPVPLTLSVFHELIANLAVDTHAYRFVRGHFDVARNTLLYSWFEVSLGRAAEQHAIAALELALRHHRFGRPFKRREGLKVLLRRAVDEGLVADEHISPYPAISGFGRAWSGDPNALPRTPDDADGLQPYVAVLCDALPALRNRFAHGDPGFAPTAFATLSACRDVINRLVLVGSPANSVGRE